MDDAQIVKLVADFGFSGDDVRKVTLLCREVERLTRHAYFSVIQAANNAATNREITAREIEAIAFSK